MPIPHAHPFWLFVCLWAVASGALASNQLSLAADVPRNLSFVFLWVGLGWYSLWQMVADGGRRWPGAAATPERRISLPALPYTRPHSAGAWLTNRLSRLVSWWQGVFWPAEGARLAFALLVVLLIVVLSLLLPDRLRWLNAGFAVLLGWGVVQRLRDAAALAARAFLVGLSWLAGHLTFASSGWPSLLLGLLFSLAAWGLLRMAERRAGGLWLLVGGQVLVATVLACLEQPLAVGAIGLLLIGQVALQVGPQLSQNPEGSAGRTWPWLLVAMLVAAWALP